MPLAPKPCNGVLSEETQELLKNDRNRAPWGTYRCEVCGHTGGVHQVAGRWVPEQHWPSAVYPRRDKKGKNLR